MKITEFVIVTVEVDDKDNFLCAENCPFLHVNYSDYSFYCALFGEQTVGKKQERLPECLTLSNDAIK